MAGHSSEMNELYGRGTDGKLWVMNGRLVKKEIKSEEEKLQKNIGDGIKKKGEIVCGGSGKGTDVSSVFNQPPSQPSSLNAIFHPQNAQRPLSSVKVEMTNGGNPLLDELQQLREAAVENERILKDKELLNSMLMAKLEQVRKEKAEEQQRNAQLVARLRLEMEKLKTVTSSMDKKTETTIDQSVEMDVASVAATVPIQPSRATIAAQLLGIDRLLLDEPRNELKEKFEESEFNLRKMRNAYDALLVDYRKEQSKHLKAKQMYKAEQKVAAKLRKKLKEKENSVTTTPEELAAAVQFGDEQPMEESNGPITSPPLAAIKLGTARRMSQSLLAEEQLDDDADGDDAGRMQAEETGASRSGHLTATRRANASAIVRGSRQAFGESGYHKTLPTMRVKSSVVAAASTDATVPTAGGVFKCPTCTDHVAFSSAQLLARHEKRLHGDRQHCRLQCPECVQTCKTNFDLQKHMRTHTGEKPFKCRECGRAFAQNNALTRHERTHTGQRPFKCPICQLAFAHKGTLIAHSRVHSGERPYSCPHCARQFKQVSHCRLHASSRCPKRPSATD